MVIISVLVFVILGSIILESRHDVNWLLIIPGIALALGGFISGLLLVIAGQLTRATVDNADNTGQMLKLMKSKRGI